MVQHRERWMRAEHRADPDDAERTDAEHRADRRIQYMPAAAQNARRNLVQIAERFKEQDAQDVHGGPLDHGASGVKMDEKKSRNRRL